MLKLGGGLYARRFIDLGRTCLRRLSANWRCSGSFRPTEISFRTSWLRKTNGSTLGASDSLSSTCLNAVLFSRRSAPLSENPVVSSAINGHRDGCISRVRLCIYFISRKNLWGVCDTGFLGDTAALPPSVVGWIEAEPKSTVLHFRKHRRWISLRSIHPTDCKSSRSASASAVN